MAKNLTVQDTKPFSLSVEDTKPRGEAVLDVKPNMLLVDSQTDDFIATELGRGMSVGPGWFMYVTYPQTTLALK